MLEKSQPLAYRLRPKNINDIIGQNHLLNKNGVIYNMIKSKEIVSFIFYGNPGIGKTTLALAICIQLQIPYSIFNAAIDNKEQLNNIITLAKASDSQYVIILEEIHRLNKDKQDILLPYLENGTITILASTTENPYYAINPAIRSRCNIAKLNPLSPNELYLWLKKQIDDKKIIVNIKQKLLNKIILKANGDVRSCLNIMEILEKFYFDKEINIEIINNLIENNLGNVAGYGDEHYDLLSAFHKSIRGSDPDAAIYYLARLLIKKDFISLNRRLIACAYEDIGLANAALCSRVILATNAALEVGWPECKQIYASIVVEMCLSPKSNSAINAIVSTLSLVEKGKIYDIPNHLKDNNYASSYHITKNAYIYPHNYKYHWVKQQYLPDEIKDKKFYKSSNIGNEEKLNFYLEQIKSQSNKYNK